MRPVHVIDLVRAAGRRHASHATFNAGSAVVLAFSCRCAEFDVPAVASADRYENGRRHDRSQSAAGCAEAASEFDAICAVVAMKRSPNAYYDDVRDIDLVHFLQTLPRTTVESLAANYDGSLGYPAVETVSTILNAVDGSLL
jgi:hypothetical protein